MLKMLTCDKFRIDPTTNEPVIINFENGLNVVKGTLDNKNSIGKSTLLLLVDFALGGLDYEAHCNITINKIGHHTVRWILEVNEKSFYCSRSTEHPEVINYYDSTFSTINASVTVDDYLKDLQNLYSLPEDFTYRQMVGPYIRVYQRPTTNERLPIASYIGEQPSKSILNLLKLYNVYNNLQELIKRKNDLDDEIKTYKKSSDYKYIRKITKEEYEKNLKEIERLKQDRDSLLKKYEDKKYEPQFERNNESALIASTLTELETKRDNLIARKNSLESLSSINLNNFRANLEELKTFFDGQDFRKIEDVETFHLQIASIFNAQTEKEKRKINNEIATLDGLISEFKEKYKVVNHIETLPELIIRQHTDLTSQIKKMEDEDVKYETNNSNLEKLDKMKKDVEKESKHILGDLESKINEGLIKLNKNFYNGAVTAPSIKFFGIENKYIYSTPSDEGTGTSQKGAILFDIFALQETKLPIIVHDTIILKHIEDYTIQQIIKLYNTIKNKQIIIAYDGDKEIDEEAQKILAAKTRIELAGGSMALFGEEFNK